MSSQREIREGTRQLIDLCRSETRPYLHKALDMDLVVLPGVWSPKYFRGSESFAREVSKRAGLPFLEIGTGTGIVACAVAKKCHTRTNGAILATDINPNAVKNAKINAIWYDLEGIMEVKYSDVYSDIDRNFRTIFWNVPFFDKCESGDNLLAWATYNVLEWSTYDPNYKVLRRFVCDTKKHLYPDGNLLIGFQTAPEKREVLEQLASDAGLTKPELVVETGYKLPNDARVEFGLYEFHVPKS